MIEIDQIYRKFARQIETAFIESFYEAFGKNVEDCLDEITLAEFTLPPEENVFLQREYSYQDFCFLRIRGFTEIKDTKAKFILQINKYKPNHGNS